MTHDIVFFCSFLRSVSQKSFDRWFHLWLPEFSQFVLFPSSFAGFFGFPVCFCATEFVLLHFIRVKAFLTIVSFSLQEKGCTQQFPSSIHKMPIYHQKKNEKRMDWRGLRVDFFTTDIYLEISFLFILDHKCIKFYRFTFENNSKNISQIEWVLLNCIFDDCCEHQITCLLRKQ